VTEHPTPPTPPTPPMHPITPYRIEVGEEELDDLRDRLGRARWPGEVAGAGWSRGVPVGWLRELAAYWRDGYDWPAWQARLNAVPQFRTAIDGAAVHFLHVRSPVPDALPLLVTHGWPGSVVEFLDVLGPLVDPAAHGGDPADAFHLVVPSIPGFGWSGPTGQPGWTVRRLAGAWAELMSRLGYDRYGAQGGDWGHAISLELGRQRPDRVLGVHVNTLFTPPPADPAVAATLDDADRARLARLVAAQPEMSGYAAIQGTRPQTLSYGLTDSPVGQLAWIAEKFHDWTGPDSTVDRDVLLTNVMLYWLTRTAGSSANLYYDRAHQPDGPAAPATGGVPVGVAVFGGDVAAPVRRLAEREHRIVHWSELDSGGHFPALERPGPFVADVREFFRMLRERRTPAPAVSAAAG
jgi:pimeloyl-ACP methyl ester carboxylesterase